MAVPDGHAGPPSGYPYRFIQPGAIYMKKVPSYDRFSKQKSIRHLNTTMGLEQITARGKFLVIIPDKHGMLEKRIQVRSQHKEGIKPLVEAGIISLGGPTLVSHGFGEVSQQINGSVVLINEKTRAEVLDIVQRDVYSISGVWDLEKMQIIALGF